MQDFYFLKNNLFTTYTLEIDFKSVYPFEEDLSEVFSKIASLYDKEKFEKLNEAQLEEEFIAKVLEILGWHSIPQEDKIIQGKNENPDWLLFNTKESKDKYQRIPSEKRKSSNEGICVIFESKKYDIPIDNKKIENNPHFQLLRYLNNLRVNFGFLSNGKFWRFYDNTKLRSEKIFYEINLEAIIEKGDIEAFKYFYYVFNAQNFTPKEKTSQNALQEILQKNAESKTKIEDNLRSIIYGINSQDSVFEKIGTCIYEGNKEVSLGEIYENTLYFMFRLLFIAYFEDKFSDTLEQHEYFGKEISVHTLLENLGDAEDKFGGFVKLQKIFEVYEKGEPNYDMPIFNGGLFDAKKTKPLSTPKTFSDKTLKEILYKLFYYHDGLVTMRRDYRTLSISHLGTIYEGLLAYFFEISNKETYYIEYLPKDAKKSKKTLSLSIEGYYDGYEYSEINQKNKIVRSQYYPSGQIYLKNTSNSRKGTASYYTPESLTSFLVKECLEDKITKDNIMTFKVLDNACGSGHFLIEALNFITLDVLEKLDSFPKLKEIYETEKALIIKNTAQYIKNYKIDESNILKRLLLKRMIYGVDVNPFSIELTKLSLWIDSFIFGTPLSFIEHHIKCGNSLVGTSISKFKAYCSTQELSHKNTKNIASGTNLFMNNFLNDFDKLSVIFEKLDSLKDNTEEEILESKRLYHEEISPELTKLNLYLNYQNARFFLTKEEDKIFKDYETGDIEEIFSSQECKDIINFYAKKYRFFNFEIEFPEIVNNREFEGFQAIIGNPPWDVVRFSDVDFFPQYQSNYRTLIDSKKREFAINLLADPEIKQKYEEQKAFIQSLASYYKAKYPLNRGDGGGGTNLFRLLLERNLSLLAEHSDLGYVLPSAIMFEEGSKTLRKHILEEKTLELFYSFENNEGIFPDVHRSYKFALMKIKNTPPPAKHTIKTMFYKTNVDSVYKPENIIPLDIELITSLSPEHLALPELRGTETLPILNKGYKSFSSLSPKWLDFRQEVVNSDKDIYKELGDGNKEGYLPLYEGRMIHQFNCHFDNPKYYLDPKEFDERLKSKEIHRLKQDLGLTQKEYEKLIAQNNLKEEDFIKYDREFYKINYRKIARDTDERTGIFTLLPKNVGYSDSLYGSIPKQYKYVNGKIISLSMPRIKLLFALGIFNSIVIDFLLRQMVQINVNKTYIERLPLPQPSTEEIENNPTYKTIALNALKLQLSNNWEDFAPLAEEFNIARDDLPPYSKLYDILKAQNDIAVAKLYGLNQDDMRVMIESFKVLQTKQPAFVSLLVSNELWK